MSRSIASAGEPSRRGTVHRAPSGSASRLLAAVVLAALAAGAAVLADGEVYPVEELRPGQRGTLTTVIQGNEVEQIELEILGVQQDGIAPGVPLVFCRLADDRGRWTGVAAGMSGSPVTVEGRLVGALAYSIGSFSKEPVCGITPIESMLALESYPGGRAPDARDTSRAAGSTARVPLVFAATGWTPAVEERDRDLWDRLAENGLQLAAAAAPQAGSGGEAQGGLEPGSAVSALLVWGDLQVGATGTVTWREGDEILAFGHPFLGRGKTELPLAPARVIFTVPSLLSSFKISEIGEPVGTLTQDRLTAIRGEIGRIPDGIPMSVTVARSGRPEQRVDVRLARDAQLLPMLSDLVVRQAVSLAIGLEGAEALRMKASVRLADDRELTIEQAGGGAPGRSAVQLLGLSVAQRLAMLTVSEFEMPDVAEIRVAIENAEPDGAWTVKRALPDRIAARPGERVRVAIDLEGPRGLARRESLTLDLPEDARPGSYVLLAGSEFALSGEMGSVSEARRRTARNAEDYLDAISEGPSPLRLAVRLVRRTEGLVAHGREYVSLPSTAHQMIRSRPGGNELYRLRWQSIGGTSVELKRPLENAAKTAFEILPPETTR